MSKVKDVLTNMMEDVESAEHEYVVECLKAAVNYCFEQYHDNGGEVDPLPSVKSIGLSNEYDKFTLLEYFLKTLQP